MKTLFGCGLTKLLFSLTRKSVTGNKKWIFCQTFGPTPNPQMVHLLILTTDTKNNGKATAAKFMLDSDMAYQLTTGDTTVRYLFSLTKNIIWDCWLVTAKYICMPTAKLMNLNNNVWTIETTFKAMQEHAQSVDLSQSAILTSWRCFSLKLQSAARYRHLTAFSEWEESNVMRDICTIGHFGDVKAICHTGCCDKHNCLRRTDLILAFH